MLGSPALLIFIFLTALNLLFPCFSLLHASSLFILYQDQKRIDGTTREVKKVRKARNRRQEWNMMAYDKEFRPDNRLSQNIYPGASSEGSLSPETRSVDNKIYIFRGA